MRNSYVLNRMHATSVVKHVLVSIIRGIMFKLN